MITEQKMEVDNNYSEQNASVDLMYVIDDMWKGFKRFFWMLPIVVLIFATGSFTVERARYHSVYEAFTSFAINTRTAYGYTSTYYNQIVAKQLSKTFPYIITSVALQDIVKGDLGVNQLNGTITASSLEKSSVFTIKVTSTDPQSAYDILQSVIKNYPTVAEYVIGETQLQVIDESGVPTKPTNNAQYKRAILFGSLIGVFVFAVFLIIYAVTRHTVRGEEDLKRNLSIAYLGAIPHIKIKVRSRNSGKTILMDSKETPSALGECMRTIRTRFIREADTIDAQSILVTSASKGEGKTSVAINLAISLSRQDIRVILVDADLRNPSIAREMGFDLKKIKSRGTVNVLKGEIAPEEALIEYGEYGVKVLPGSDPIKTSGALLGGKEMDKMMSAYSAICDVIIVDAPPCGEVADAAVIARKMDGIVFVVRQDYARVNLVLESIENIADTGTNMILSVV